MIFSQLTHFSDEGRYVLLRSPLSPSFVVAFFPLQVINKDHCQDFIVPVMPRPHAV